ncbi:glycosyltransferase family 25 protein [Aquimarina sp. RZ0]|uniref:glycosyltransferase family 25 protein n=1 Tax=Aquimarina sp. RZ0 TaxID=2607730 RepID=UPI0011F10A08|nr:glycosyltransferase family 25 protein [Aquimarina sp. RZ0]KAA1242919.1 hypothetical protein F0000_23375 [Aquimarina sp. RZ0]
MKIKTYIVNLNRRGDRKKELITKIPRILDYQFISDLGLDCDGNLLTENDFDTINCFDWQLHESNNGYYNRPLKLGEVGCSLSHLNTWKEAVKQDVPYVMVLEDDVIFRDDFSEQINKALKFLQTNYPKWDLLYLGRIPLEKDKKIINEQIVAPGYSYGAYAYIVSKKGIEKLLKSNLESNIIPSDEFLPAMYIDHPREDIQKIFKKSLQAYALHESIVFPGDPNIIGSDTEESSYIMKERQEIKKDHNWLNNNLENPVIENTLLDISDWKLWCERYVDPLILKNFGSALVQEVAEDVIQFPLFTEKFCQDLLDLVSKHDWIEYPKFAPEFQSFETLNIDFHSFKSLLSQFIVPIIESFWHTVPASEMAIRADVEKFDSQKKTFSNLHHDDCFLSLSIRLNEDFYGGGTFFPRLNKTITPKKIGWAICYPGSVTHRHAEYPLDFGDQYSLKIHIYDSIGGY